MRAKFFELNRFQKFKAVFPHGLATETVNPSTGNAHLPDCDSGVGGNKIGICDYRRMGGDRPAEVFPKESGSNGLDKGAIAALDRFIPASGVEMTPTAVLIPELTVAARTCGALAAIRQAFRLPEAASTAMISGCKSSVREITGNRRARAQTIATASIFVLCRGSRRDKVQRYRHSQTAPKDTTSQAILSSASNIGSFGRYSWGGPNLPSPPCDAFSLNSISVYYGSQIRGKLCKRRFSRGICTAALVWRRQQ